MVVGCREVVLYNSVIIISYYFKSKMENEFRVFIITNIIFGKTFPIVIIELEMFFIILVA